MFSLCARRISRVSRKPFVRISPVTAPVPVSRVLVATVVPCAKKSSSPRKPRTSLPKYAAALRDDVVQADGGVLRRGQLLEVVDRALLVDDHAVGERAARVDPHAQFHRFLRTP